MKTTVDLYANVKVAQMFVIVRRLSVQMNASMLNMQRLLNNDSFSNSVGDFFFFFVHFVKSLFVDSMRYATRK